MGLLTNGKIIICGKFNNINGYLREGIARLEANGTLDYSYLPGSFASSPASADTISSYIFSTKILVFILFCYSF